MKLSIFNNIESIQNVSASKFYNVLLKNQTNTNSNSYLNKFNEQLKSRKIEVPLQSSINKSNSNIKNKNSPQTTQSSQFLNQSKVTTTKNAKLDSSTNNILSPSYSRPKSTGKPIPSKFNKGGSVTTQKGSVLG